jgi:serine/threonine protein kinase
MSRIVNPYVDWLDIPDSVARPNYYQLLGISAFEDDEKKIKGGYYRRVAQVSVYQTGSNADACQLVLVELAEARDCLTDNESRATYAARIGEKHGVPPKKVKKRRNQVVKPALRKPAKSPREAPSVGAPVATSAPLEAGRHLQSVTPSSPMLRRRVSSDAQLVRLRSQSTRSPFGMFAVMKSPAEIIADLASTRGLTPLQARLVAENSPDELVVGPFVLEHELREGSWGRVFLATRMSTGELVTLRWLPGTFNPEVNSLCKLVDQVKQISARHLQRPIECGVDQDRPYLVSQYISGEDLWSLVNRTGPLSPQQAVYCAGRIVESLNATDKVGLLHLELRPSKMLVNRAGELHLRDLALANVISNRKRREPNFVQLMNVLPPEHLQFMAPEVLLNDDSPSLQSDVYSVGCILYFMLTGRCVVEHGDPMHVAMEHQEPMTPKTLQILESLPEAIKRCLPKMLAKRPADRFENYESLHQVLKSAYRELETSEAAKSILWQYVDEFTFSDDNSRPNIRRFHVGRAISSGAMAASLIAVLSFGGLYFMQPKLPEPLAAPVPKPAPSKMGPTIVRDSATEVPVVEAHDVFSIH